MALESSGDDVLLRPSSDVLRSLPVLYPWVHLPHERLALTSFIVVRASASRTTQTKAEGCLTQFVAKLLMVLQISFWQTRRPPGSLACYLSLPLASVTASAPGVLQTGCRVSRFLT